VPFFAIGVPTFDGTPAATAQSSFKASGQVTASWLPVSLQSKVPAQKLVLVVFPQLQR
jgi:hypothetical protein